MKRQALLRHLRENGCELLREGADIPGGTILPSIHVLLFPVITKYKTSWPRKFAKTLA